MPKIARHKRRCHALLRVLQEVFCQAHAELPPPDTYEFAPNNPYLSHADPLAEGRELFAAGLLSEAALALEAELQANGDR